MAKKKKKMAKKITKKLVKKPRKILVKKKNVKKKPVAKKVIKKKIVKKAVVRIKKRRAVASAVKENFIAESFFKAKIKVIGIGGGGGSIVSEIGRSLHKATFVVADTDTRAFKKRQGIKYFLFGQKMTHGLGTGVNPELGRQAAEVEKERIAHFFQDQDIVIFIASLGGGVGSGATQIFAEAARNFNGITFGIFTLPFKFEGKNKYKIAMKALGTLRKSLNVSITIPNEKIFKIIDANTAITDAFSIVNKSLIESLESLIDLIYTPGIINIDFADLRVILNGRGNMAFLNTAEAGGKNRAAEISEKILHNPLYQTAHFKSEKILFNIEGGANLSMLEVDKISKAISEKNPKAKIIFGISKNASLKNKIKTTLLMTGGGTAVDLPVVVKPPVIKKPKPVVVSKPPVVIIKVVKKVKRVRPKVKKKVIQEAPVEQAPMEVPPAVFATTPVTEEISNMAIQSLQAQEATVTAKKTIRRSGLEVKKAEEDEVNKQTSQEKEWEIPAFLRIKK